MEPWHKTATPRKEVRQGRSFNPDEFAIALEQVVAGTAPDDYKKPKQFFDRTCFTEALRSHCGQVLRRLSGETTNAAPVLALITQFGGGKTHTLTALYHLVRNGKKRIDHPGLERLLKEARLSTIPRSRVAVFVGNAWDPSRGNETPWIDLARQLAGDKGVATLGSEAKTKAPGTDNLRKLFEAAGGSVLILCDEVLNFLSRHRDRAEAFRDFFANLVRALTGTTGSAAVISLPQSKPEMSDWDLRWQEIIVKEVNRVAKNLISNNEAEISEVVRRRLFEDLGSDRVRKNTAKTYADWCFERRAQLPPEWTAVDTASTDTKAREFLRTRFEACYPFHPATLSVFQRKWQMLPQYQQTRGTLAMFAQWISKALEKGYRQAWNEPLITLGSAPLDVPEFRAMVLGQLGEPRLAAAIETDIAGDQSHAKALDADAKGPLTEIHRRVGAAILFESSGGQRDKLGHLPELRFALGEPGLDTTSIDTAAIELERKAFFIRKVGSDGFRVSHQPTLKKVKSDRRASLDDEEVTRTMRSLVQKEFDKGKSIPVAFFPVQGADVQDSPRLVLVVMDPDVEWDSGRRVREQTAEWTRRRGDSDRLYPAALVWCFKNPGRAMRNAVEDWLAWKRVDKEIREGTLGEDIEPLERAEASARARDAEEAAREEVWASYRFVVVMDSRESDGLKVIDIGAGHASSGETLCGRVLATLKSDGLLSESVGASYIDRNWPPALKESGAWPLASLRQCFLNGTLIRLIDPDAVLPRKIVEFVEGGTFGLASARQADGTYEHLWFREQVGTEEARFDADIYLVRKDVASTLKAPVQVGTETGTGTETGIESGTETGPGTGAAAGSGTGAGAATQQMLRLSGEVPPEVWNRLGTRIIPKLRSGSQLRIGVDFAVTVDSERAPGLAAELRSLLADLRLSDDMQIRIE
jgi:hypothetical protein